MAGRIGTRCVLCGSQSRLISATLGVCGSCLRARPTEALARTSEAHAASRRAFHLPEAPPQTEAGVACSLCARACRIGEGERGYCGLRTVRRGRLVHLAGNARRGLLRWYRDPLPTNCVADWVCAGRARPGYHNLAVFYASCSSNCLFCQNWGFRATSVEGARGVTAADLAAAANRLTFCVCFFGGDPSSQMPHALAAGALLAAKGVVVCWETAGASHPRLLDRAVRISLATGGCIKFDLKAYDETLHVALTGSSNRQTLENFSRAARRAARRRQPPLVVASTLLVPGYVDAEEVHRIARFVAEQDPEIPYALLAFAPHFLMRDLPPTSFAHAEDALRAARDAGLHNVHIGNRHLLSRGY
jgi:pyruvate formate lyase activating enzyme